MSTGKTSIRPLQRDELRKVVEYFYAASDTLLETMGVDRAKYLPEAEWRALLDADFDNELTQRQFFYVGWEYEGELIGHCNINNIIFGDRANIHAHIWNPERRMSGLGLRLLRDSVGYFFAKFDLRMIIAEPCADNPGPNRVLRKLGLTPVRTYECVPGWINFKQTVHRYEITAPLSE